jgi:hypothetical protein
MEFPNLRATGHVRTSTGDPGHVCHTSRPSLSPSPYTVSPLDCQPCFPSHIARRHASYKGACISLPLSHFLFLHSASVTVAPSIVRPASESLPTSLALLTVPPLQLHPCRLVFLATHPVSDWSLSPYIVADPASPDAHAHSPPSSSFWLDAHAPRPPSSSSRSPCTTTQTSTYPCATPTAVLPAQLRRAHLDDDSATTGAQPRR